MVLEPFTQNLRFWLAGGTDLKGTECEAVDRLIAKSSICAKIYRQSQPCIIDVPDISFYIPRDFDVKEHKREKRILGRFKWQTNFSIKLDPLYGS